MREAAYKEH